MTENESNLYNIIIKRIEDIGMARQMIKDRLDDEMFDNLSKHDSYWHSQHELEAEKLDDSRCKLIRIKEFLWDLQEVLNRDGLD